VVAEEDDDVLTMALATETEVAAGMAVEVAAEVAAEVAVMTVIAMVDRQEGGVLRPPGDGRGLR
jgi:hypothetical protein